MTLPKYPPGVAESHQPRRLAAARFRLLLTFMITCGTSTCWAVGMGSSIAFGDDGGSGIGELVIWLFLFALAFAWVFGKVVAAAVYAPLIVGSLLLTPISWYVTGVAPWERSLERFVGFLFVGWLLGMIAIWVWSERKSDTEQAPPGTD